MPSANNHLQRADELITELDRLLDSGEPVEVMVVVNRLGQAQTHAAIASARANVDLADAVKRIAAGR